MPPIGREPGDSTMIRVSMDVKEYLEKHKIDKEEAIGDVVERILKENRRFEKEIQSLKLSLTKTP